MLKHTTSPQETRKMEGRYDPGAGKPPIDKSGRQVTRTLLVVVVSDTLILKEVDNIFSTISFPRKKFLKAPRKDSEQLRHLLDLSRRASPF